MAYRFPYICQLDAQGRVRGGGCEDEIETPVTRSISRREERERARIALRAELGDITEDERDAL